MTLITIQIADAANPIEVQAWLDANPATTIKFLVPRDNVIYIFYE